MCQLKSSLQVHQIRRCACGAVYVNFGSVALHFEREEFSKFVTHVSDAEAALQAMDKEHERPGTPPLFLVPDAGMI